MASDQLHYSVIEVQFTIIRLTQLTLELVSKPTLSDKVWRRDYMGMVEHQCSCLTGKFCPRVFHKE